MAIAFPASPTGNLVYAFGGKSWIYDSTKNSWDSQNLTPYDLAGGIPESPTANQIIAKFDISRDIYFPANFAASSWTAIIAATALTTFNVNIGNNLIGTIVFAAGSTTATFTSVSTGLTTIAAGSILTITAPSTPDTTLTGVAGTLSGYLLLVNS